MGRFNYLVSSPTSNAASATPLSPYYRSSPQQITGLPNLIQYPSPVSPSTWTNEFIEPHYGLPNVMSAAGAGYRSVGSYDEHSSRQEHLRRHPDLFDGFR